MLVADDSSLNLDVARHVLELEGARVTVCMRGEEAIDLLSNPDTVVDVVLMDVQMPGIDGNEAVRRLRRVPHLQDVPVIALSAAVQSEDRARAIAAGMTDFLSASQGAETQTSSSFMSIPLSKSALAARARRPRSRPRRPVPGQR